MQRRILSTLKNLNERFLFQLKSELLNFQLVLICWAVFEMSYSFPTFPRNTYRLRHIPKDICSQVTANCVQRKAVVQMATYPQPLPRAKSCNPVKDTRWWIRSVLPTLDITHSQSNWVQLPRRIYDVACPRQVSAIGKWRPVVSS